ncbi:MAG: S8 family peptidase [Anaerolineae bacterium]
MVDKDARVLGFYLTLLLTGSLFAWPILAKVPGTWGEFAPGQVLFKFRPGVRPGEAQAALFRAEDDLALPPYALSVAGEIKALGVKRLSVPPGRELAAIEILRQNPLVEFAEPNYLVRAALTPNDPDFYWQWGLTQINAPAAWDVTTGSGGMTVAIVDSGLDLDHPDLAEKLWQNPGEIPGNGRDDDGNGKVDDFNGWRFYNSGSEDNYVWDDCGHGSHVAGIAGASTNNGLGVAGLSWGARLMAVRILDASCWGYVYDVAQGIIYAADEGADVINLSLAWYGSCTNTAQGAINHAYDKGSLVVAAAGNISGYIYPAACENVFGVAATDSWDNHYYNSGSHVDVSAPGVNIYSTVPNDTYNYKSGTSMATPHVAGLAALVWPLYPDYTNDQLQKRIEQTAVDLGSPGWDEYYGHGRIDAYQAVCRPDLAADPLELTFLADDDEGPIPPSHTARVLSNGYWPLDWTGYISPTSTSWLTITPISGTASSSEPGAVNVYASKPASYGTYTAQVVLEGVSPYVDVKPRAVNVTLIYIPQLIHYYFPIIMKGYSNNP